MKRFTDIFTRSTVKLKDQHFVKNPGPGLHKQHMMNQENKRKVAEFYRMQQQALKHDLGNNKVVSAMKTVLGTLIPSSLPMQLLKIKIQVQTLIGSTFNIHFKGLEASKEQLRNYKQLGYSMHVKKQRTTHDPT
jgi:hypothetical protein